MKFEKVFVSSSRFSLPWTFDSSDLDLCCGMSVSIFFLSESTHTSLCFLSVSAGVCIMATVIPRITPFELKVPEPQLGDLIEEQPPQENINFWTVLRCILWHCTVPCAFMCVHVPLTDVCLVLKYAAKQAHVPFARVLVRAHHRISPWIVGFPL